MAQQQSARRNRAESQWQHTWDTLAAVASTAERKPNMSKRISVMAESVTPNVMGISEISVHLAGSLLTQANVIATLKIGAAACESGGGHQLGKWHATCTLTESACPSTERRRRSAKAG
jgi:hypothetical protein